MHNFDFSNEAYAHQHTHAHGHSHGDNGTAAAHPNHPQQCAQSITGTLGLFVALSLHSAIEGLAIGVQNSSAKVSQ